MLKQFVSIVINAVDVWINQVSRSIALGVHGQVRLQFLVFSQVYYKTSSQARKNKKQNQKQDTFLNHWVVETTAFFSFHNFSKLSN